MSRLDVAELAGRLSVLYRAVAVAAADDDLTTAAEAILPLDVEFARLYRTWLAARQGPAAGDDPAVAWQP